MNLLDTSVYSYVSECGTFDWAVARLDSSYVKPVNEVFARHRVNTCQQTQGESLDDFLQRLKSLGNECNFVDSTAVQIKQAAIRDDFIAGLTSGYNRQCISENNILSLNAVFDKARALNDARKILTFMKQFTLRVAAELWRTLYLIVILVLQTQTMLNVLLQSRKRVIFVGV